MATKAIKAAASKTPTPISNLEGQESKPSKVMASVGSPQDRQVLTRSGAKLLTKAQIEGSVPAFCTNDKAIDFLLRHGAQGLLDEFAPADAVESTYAAVIVGIRNAVMTSMYLANREEGRDVELAVAFRGAAVLTKLLEAYDAHRGHGGRRFTVGNVNVEPGAQAIVGNVETTPRQEPRIQEAGAKANKHKPRAV
jgi:hypothetical protein